MRFLFVVFFVSFSWLSFSQVTILIDPGHGGSDPGHESANKNHLPEKDLNLIIAKKFGDYLTKNLGNITVLYTRTADNYPSLDDRVEMANTRKVDYFISIHCNGSPNKRINGTESHVHDMSFKQSVRLAQTFEKEFKGRAGRNSRGVKDSDDREHTLQVLKFTQMTSVLVECGFLTNTNEANYLNTAYGQEIIASALYRGMRDFLKAEHPTINFSKGATTVTTASKETNYTVQLMSSKIALATNGSSFSQVGEIVERKDLGGTGYRYIYYAGTFARIEDARAFRDKMRKRGFTDAMVVRKK